MPTPLRGLDNHELQLCYRYPPRVFSVRRPPHTRFQCLGSRSASRVYYLGEKAGQRETNDLYHRLRTGDLSRRCARARARVVSNFDFARCIMRVDVVLASWSRPPGPRGRGQLAVAGRCERATQRRAPGPEGARPRALLSTPSTYFTGAASMVPRYGFRVPRERYDKKRKPYRSRSRDRTAHINKTTPPDLTFSDQQRYVLTHTRRSKVDRPPVESKITVKRRERVSL